jgi:hypothetical protein
MTKLKFFRPDFIVAMLAVIIGLCTMFVYIYQAKIMSQQMHASVWPYLQTNFTDGQRGIFITINNKGVGPAIVKSAYVIADNERYADSKKNLDSLAYKLTGNKQLLNGYTNLKDRVISAGEAIDFIEVTDSASVILFKKALYNKHSISIEICYCSVYGDCWTLKGAQSVPCDTCE